MAERLIQRLGERLPDGSILLFDENIDFRSPPNMQERYRRVLQSPDKRYQLYLKGYTAVDSSFISAVSVQGDDLFIRFLNSSVYRYTGMAQHFDRMLRANSKGQYFNRNIRGKSPYEKTANMPLKNDVDISDDSIFEGLDKQFYEDLIRYSTQMFSIDLVILNDLEYHKVRIGDSIFYRPVIKSVSPNIN